MELKHCAAFFPYGLKVKIDLHFYKNHDAYEVVALSETDVELADSKGNYIGGTFELCDVKPILRPMSHLTKEIEHKGEKFVPIRYIYDKMKQRSKLSENDFNDIVCGEEGLYQYITKSWRCLFNLEESLYLNELLKELHFDVDGLIEKGEAIAKE